MADALGLSLFSRWLTPVDIGSFTNFPLDASTDGVGWVFQAQDADPITHLWFRYGVRTGTPPTYRIGLQTPTAAGGLPDGTVLGGGSPASATFTPPADATWNSTGRWIALANAYTPSRGQLLAACIEHSSGTVDGSNFSSFTARDGGLMAGGCYRPYAVLLTAGTWAKTTGTTPMFACRTATRVYGFPFTALYTTTVGTTGHRSAARFTLPAAWGDTKKILGVRLAMTAPAAGGSFKVALWDGTTELQAIAVDTDQLAINSGRRAFEFTFDEAALSTLNFGSEYRIGLEVEGSLAVGLLGLQLSEANDRLAFPVGANRGLSTWNGSTWADDDTVLPFAEPVPDDWTEPAGGGGGLGISQGLHSIEAGVSA